MLPERLSRLSRLSPLIAVSSLPRLFELRILACYGVEHLGVARLLELLEGLTAHRGIDVQIGNAEHRGQLLQQKEDHPVVDERAPVAPPHQVALLRGELRLLEHRLRIGEELPPEPMFEEAELTAQERDLVRRRNWRA